MFNQKEKEQINMLKLFPIKLMAVIYTPEFFIRDKFVLLNLFQELSGNKFDGELFSAPIPQNAPAEIPRFVLNSQDGSWKLEVSIERTSLIYIHPELSLLNNPDALDFGNFAKQFFRSYIKKNNIRIQRLAYVIERAAEIKNKTPPQFIADTFCNEKYLTEPFNRTSAFELHSLKQYPFKKFHLNSWVRLKSTQLLDENRTPILHIVSDINTLSSQEAPETKFLLKDIDRFFKFVPDELESIISLYFNK